VRDTIGPIVLGGLGAAAIVALSLFDRLFGRPKVEPLPDPVTKLVDLILGEAIRAGAHRIQITLLDPEHGTVRCYIQGEWHEVMTMPLAAYSPLVSRLIAIGKLDVARESGQPATVPVALDARVMHLPARLIVDAGNTQGVLLECPSPP